MTGAFLHPFAKPANDWFVSLVRGDGAVVWDDDGNEYIDAVASLWYCAIGHGRDEMADAVATQMRQLAGYSCFAPFTNPRADEVAARIAALSPIPDARVFLCQSGSEAIDTAIKIARVAQVQAGHPERRIVISRDRGYHGTNYGGTSAQGLPANKIGWGELLPDVVQVGADDVEELARFMAEHEGRIAAVLAEPVQGAAGVFPPPDGYLQTLRRLCDQHGAYLVFDEVITGFGRLGHWFAAERFGVTPDLTTFAKAVTSGYQPLGGVIVGGPAIAALEADPDFKLLHGYTYSGHPAACVAGLTNIDIVEREGLLDRATAIGRRLGDGLHALAADGTVATARGDGAMWAVDLVPDAGLDAAEVRMRLHHQGVIVRPIGDRTIVFCPPLVTTDDQIDRIIDTLATAVSSDHS